MNEIAEAILIIVFIILIYKITDALFTRGYDQ